MTCEDCGDDLEHIGYATGASWEEEIWYCEACHRETSVAVNTGGHSQ